MSLTNFNKIDISSRHQKFENLDKTNFRDIIRDLYDLLIRRPIYKILYKNFFKNQNYKIDYTIPAKGLSTLKRFKILNDFKKIEGLRVLNIGCGNGFTYHHLFKFKPKSIYGIDVLNYSNAWNDVNEYVHKHNIKTEVKFEMLDIIDLDPSLKFDLIISEAVFEHCKDFKTVAKVLFNSLNKGGVLYSSYGGPLWYTWGGDHFSGRDKIENGYNHLLLNKDDYQNYFNKNVGSLEYELNEGGGGGILVENDLFSKLSGNEYMEMFHKEGFVSLKTIVELDPVALKVIKSNPDLKKKLINLNLPVSFEDFYLKTHIVYLEKNV